MTLLDVIVQVNGVTLDCVRVPAPMDARGNETIPGDGDDVLVAIRRAGSKGRWTLAGPTKMETK